MYPTQARKRLQVSSWLLGGLSLLMIPNMWGATGIWIGPAGTQDWDDTAHWSSGIRPGTTGTTNNVDSAVFNSAPGDSWIDTPENLNLQKFIFQPGAGNYTFGIDGANANPPIRLSHGGHIDIQAGYTGARITFDAPIHLYGNATFENRATNTNNYVNPPQLLFNGDITKAIAGDATLFLAGSTGSRNRSVNEANRISGIISDGSAGGKLTLSLSGTGAERGAWYLSGLNTFTGDFIGTSGTLFFNTIGNANAASSLGKGDTVRLSGGIHMMYTGGVATTNRNFIIGTGGATWFNNGSGSLTISEESLISTGSSSLTFRGARDFIIDGKITGTASVTRTDGGTVYFNNVDNDFTGNISIAHGTFSAKSIANSGVISAIGQGLDIRLGQTSGGTALPGNTGKLIIAATSDQSTNREIIISNGLNTGFEVGGGIIENATANTRLTLNGNVRASNTTTRSYFTLGGVGNGLLSGVIQNANLELLKTGNGIWSLNQANQHRGGTIVQTGTLLVNNTSGSATGTGGLIINGTSTFGGSGSATGSAGVTIDLASTAKLMVGNTHDQVAGFTNPIGHTAQASQLTLGSATNVAITLAGTLQFDLFSNEGGTSLTEADRLILRTTASNLALEGSIHVANSSGTRYQWTAGEWQIMDWSGVDTGTTTVTGTPTFQLATNALRIGYKWDTSEVMSTGVLKSVVDSNAFIWTGEGSNNEWNTLENWNSGAIPQNTNDVIFGAISNVGTTTVTSNLAGDKNIRNLLITGERNYEISTSIGVLYFNGSLLHSQGGTQKITTQIRPQTSSSFMMLVDSGSLETNGLMAANHSTWTFDGAGNMSVDSFSRRGNHNVNIVKNGTGTLTIRNFNTGSHVDGYTAAGVVLRGSVTVNNGTLRIRDERSLGGTPDTFAPTQLTVNGGRLVSYGDTVIDDENRGVTVGSSGASLGAESASHKLTIANTITGTGPVEIRGDGEVKFSSANTYTGNTNVTQGKFWVSNLTGSGTGTGSVFVTGNAHLGGSGILAPAAGKQIQLATTSTLTVGDLHGSATPQALWLGDPTNATSANIHLQGTLQFDITGAGSLAAWGDVAYNSTSTNAADLLVLSSTGMLDLSDAQIQLSALSTTGWEDGQRWKLIDWSNQTPDSLDTSGITLTNSQFNEFTLLTTIATDGLYVVAVIPEPSKALLLFLGVSLSLFRRKRSA